MYYSLLSEAPSFDNASAVARELKGTMTSSNTISIESTVNIAAFELPLYLEQANGLLGRGKFYEVTDMNYDQANEAWTLHIEPYDTSTPDVNAFINAFGGQVVKETKAPTIKSLPSYTPRHGIPILKRSQRDYLKATMQFWKWNKLWGQHRIGLIRNVGNLMELITTTAPKSQAEWEEIYFFSGQGRTIEQIEGIAMHWSRVSGLIPEHALAHVMIHVIDETWDGYKREQDVLTLLNSRHPQWRGSVFRPEYKYDTDYAIDLAVHDQNSEHGFTVGVQVKPSTYFRSGDLRHRLSVLDKHKKARADLGVEVFTIDADKSLQQGRPVLYSIEEVEQILMKNGERYGN